MVEKIKYVCVKCGDEAVVERIPVSVDIDAVFYNQILDIINYNDSLYTNISDFINSALRKEIHLNMGIKYDSK